GMPDSFFQTQIRQPFEDFIRLSPDQRAGAIRAAVPDLNLFLDAGKSLEERNAPARSIELAKSLLAALEGISDDSPAARSGTREATLPHRVVTNAMLREEADRDQNVYLGRLFTRTLTQAVPDLIFQPVSTAEASAALRWAAAQ